MPHITLIAHNIRSAHNVGSIFRTAEGFGVREIVLSGYTPYPLEENDCRLPHIAHRLTAQIHKTALGAELSVPFSHYETLDEWMEHNQTRTHPLPLVALEQSLSSQLIQTYEPPESLALLLGEEVHGINEHYLNQCSDIVEVPMQGQKESFNVAVACGIALYALNFNGHAFSAEHRYESLQ